MVKNLGLAVALAVPLSACVTINIYFPAAAAEKAADKIIDEVYQLDSSKRPEQKQPAPSSPTTPPAKQ